MNKENTIYDKRITSVKAIAILSVVCAHTSAVEAGNSLASDIISAIMVLFGTWGVPTFFVISGLLFSRTSLGLKDFVKSKMKGIVIPWVFCYSLLYIYVVVRKGGFSILGWISFVLGYNCSSYYLSMLTVLYILFWFFRKRDICIYFLTVLSGIWICLYPYGLLGNIPNLFPTNYLNPLFWVFWFGMGIIIDRKTLFEKIASFSKKYLLAIIFVVIAFSAIAIYQEFVYMYFTKYAVIIYSFTTLLIIGLSGVIKDVRIVEYVGKLSFSIYLLNQLFAGLIVFISNKINFSILILLRPAFVIGIVVLGLLILIKINKATNGKTKVALQLLGIRREL